VHASDDTTTELGPDGIERHGPDGLLYEAGGLTGEERIGCRTVRCMSAAFQMRSHTGYERWLDRPENGHRTAPRRLRAR
jgi:hypothetical protein